MSQLQNGEFRPIGYASRKLRPAEKNYSPTEGECLAVVWSLEKWKPYVLDQLCQVNTDHEAIFWLWYKAELSGRLIRWILRMQEFNLQIIYKPSKEMIVPDALSRMFGGTQIKREDKDNPEIDYPEDEEEEPSKNFPIKIIGSVSETCDANECKSPKGTVIKWIQCDCCGKWLHMVCVGMKKKVADRIEFYTCSGCTESAGNSDLNDEITVETTRLNQPFIEDIQVALLDDEEFSPIIEFLQEDRLAVNKKLAKQIPNVAKSYSYENGLLYKLTKGNKRVIVIPKKLRNSDFHQMYEIPLGGHLGIRKTISRIETEGFWWKKMARDIKKWVRSCNVCCRDETRFQKTDGDNGIVFGLSNRTMAGVSIGFNWTPSEILC